MTAIATIINGAAVSWVLGTGGATHRSKITKKVHKCTNKYGFDLFLTCFVRNFGEFLGNFSGGYLRWGYFLIYFSTSK